MVSANGQPTRVLMTADTVGGVWTYALQLIAALAKHGVQITLATMGRSCTPSQLDEAARLSNLTLVESDYKLEWMDDCQADVDAAGDWLMELESTVQPDLVHLNGYVHGALPWKAPVLVVGHSCVLSWWAAVRRTELPQEWNWYRREVARGLRSADLVVAPSRAMLAELHRYYGPLPRAQTIHNGCEVSTFSPGRKESFIFTAGRLWDDAKNVRALKDVAGKLSWPIYLAGSEHGERDCEIHGAVSLGHLSHEQVRNWLSRAAIYALPARYEPFGLSILEAALSGCALVIGDIPSLREIWGETAAYVAPEDHKGIREAITSLIDDPARRIEMAERARVRAQLYTSQRMAAGYVSAYRWLNAYKQQSGRPACSEVFV